jgi:EAL domain-containing protein (putative c-di-GMP-specific phosphodiesterase class I)
MIDFCLLPFDQNDLDALSQLSIDMVFQPIYDARDLSVSAFEALMRPDGKPPMELIAEYQAAGKLAVIELATCFGATMEYRKRGYTQKLCINSLPSEVLSKEQFKLYYDTFPEMEGNIVVEIVEYTSLNKHKWNAKKKNIREHHLQVALDDYSTGHNDSSAVDVFSPHFIKLDRSLISDIDRSSEKQKHVAELVEHFHQLGVRVVAEGIETKEELDYLRNEIKVDFLQGFYLGKPQ